MMTAKDYYSGHCLALVRIFRDEQRRFKTDSTLDARQRVEAAGRAAAIALSHVADYIAVEENGGRAAPAGAAERIRSGIGCPSLAVLNDAADATKHSRLRSATRYVLSSTGVEVTGSAWGRSAWGSPWNETVHIVKADNSEARPIDAWLDQAIAAWNRHFGI